MIQHRKCVLWLLALLTTLLLFSVLKRMTRAVWRSFFVAAIFALHPLRVESVAWAAERKDVMSVFFGLGSFALSGFRFFAFGGRAPGSGRRLAESRRSR